MPICISQLFSQGAFGYVLPIMSFILAWIEAWFLDFKVLPHEAEEENRELLRCHLLFIIIFTFYFFITKLIS